MQRTFGKDDNGNDHMKPSWGCYWAGQWMENIEYAAKQGMELIAVYKPDGQGRGELDRFPSREDWDGTDGKSFAKNEFLGGSQVVPRRNVYASTSVGAHGGARCSCLHVHCCVIHAHH